MLELKLLLLLAVANGTPVVAARIFRNRWQAPIDAGRRLADGRPLFGSTKTWRGLVLAVAATAVAGTALGLPWQTALTIGAAAMAGDLLSSFIKRRRGLTASSRAPLLDQVPESLLPLLVAQYQLGFGWSVTIVVCVAFVVLAIGLSPLLYHIGIRRQPH